MSFSTNYSSDSLNYHLFESNISFHTKHHKKRQPANKNKSLEINNLTQESLEKLSDALKNADNKHVRVRTFKSIKKTLKLDRDENRNIKINYSYEKFYTEKSCSDSDNRSITKENSDESVSDHEIDYREELNEIGFEPSSTPSTPSIDPYISDKEYFTDSESDTNSSDYLLPRHQICNNDEIEEQYEEVITPVLQKKNSFKGKKRTKSYDLQDPNSSELEMSPSQIKVVDFQVKKDQKNRSKIVRSHQQVSEV